MLVGLFASARFSLLATAALCKMQFTQPTGKEWLLGYWRANLEANYLFLKIPAFLSVTVVLNILALK